MNTRTFLRGEFIALIALLSFATLWFAGIELLSPNYFLWDDNVTAWSPIFIFNAQALFGEHVLPVIDFFQFAGWDVLGAGQPGALYPPIYLAVWIASALLKNSLLTIDLLSILHLTGGMFAMYAWLRTLGLQRILAIAGAIFYLTLPFTTILSRSWVMVSYIHLYAPLFFLLLERDLKSPAWHTYLGYVLSKTLFAFAGYPQYVAYQALMEISYLFVRQRKEIRTSEEKAIRFCHANILVAILSLPVLLPMIQATFLSAGRSQSLSFGERTWGMTDILNVLSAQFLYFFFDPSSWPHLNTAFLLGGSIFVPWIAWKAFVLHKQVPKQVITMAMVGLIALAFSGPLSLLLMLLPIFDRFRWPFKMYVFVGVFFTTAFFLLLQWCYRERILRRKSITLILASALLFHIVVLPYPPLTVFRIKTMASPLPSYTREHYRSVAVLSSSNTNIVASTSSLPSFSYSTLWRVPSITGYDPLASRISVAISGNAVRMGLFDVDLTPALMRHLSYWSVRYLISDTAFDPSFVKQEGLYLKESHPFQFIYENLSALPIASFDEASAAPIPIEYHTNRIRLLLKGQTGNILLRIAPIEGYHLVHQDGTIESVTRTEDGILLSVKTPEASVDVVYESMALNMGIRWMMIGSILFASASLLIWCLRRLKFAWRREADNPLTTFPELSR
jgi:hypothetical protein